MTYLFLGEDTPSKDKEITSLKKKILTSDNALTFDYETLHGPRLDAKTLKKALVALPTVASKRLVIIRQCHKLSQQNKDLIVDFISKDVDHLVLILDTESTDLKNSFIQKLRRQAKTSVCSKKEKANVFEMTKAIERRQPTEALKMLSALILEGNHPLKIMPAIVWSWGQTRNRVSDKNFQDGLAALQEADFNIKRSKLRPEYALEVLVVKLCSFET